MTTRFSKRKLVEAQEKKAKGGTINGLLSKKKTGYESKKYSVMTIPPTHLPSKCPASSTLSLEMIAFASKAHEALSADNLNPLMAKSSSEVMSSYIQKLVQLLDLEEKVATSEPLVKSLSAENEMLKNKVAILNAEAKNDKKYVVTLEKSLQVEKDFCKLKDKQSGDLKLKLENYYMEGFDLLMKWMAKHHPRLDLSGLAVDDIEKELLSVKATTENVMEEAIDVAEGMKDATVITPADLVPDKQ
nr:hypothetical protein CFP56_06386 [Quercus suber]